MKRRGVTAVAVALVLSVAAPVVSARPAVAVQVTGWNPDTSIYEMVFPVDDPHRYSDTWGACRDGCRRSHEGTDIFASKMTPVFAAASGTVGWMANQQGGDCCAMALEHDDGWETWYIHLNNDTPGTDDGQGWGFAPGIEPGVRVEAGQLIGFVGDSGNAENTSAHVHFELHRPDGTKINPYPHLKAAESPSGGVPGNPVLVSYRVDDGPSHDGTGNDSVGNNDGLVQCGETIELYVTVGNDGEGVLSGLSAALSVADPYVSVLYNTSSRYPDLAPGESAENPRDWDLAIAPDTPGGRLITTSFTFTADFGGPWTVDVQIPVDCGGDVTAPEVTSMTPGNGSYEVNPESDIVAVFTEPIDPTSVTPDTFSVSNDLPISGSLAVAADGMSAAFDPDPVLDADEVYVVDLSSGIVDLAGNPLVPVVVSFSTGTIPPGVVVDVSYRVDDDPSHDGTGNDSVGNSDGLAQCGETIELYVSVRNDGELVITGLSGALSESDPYVRVLYNVDAPYPDLGPGGTAENSSDWDLRLDTATPVGHEFVASISFSVLDPMTLSLRPIDSTVDVAIPIECAPPAVTGVSPGDGSVDVPVDGAVAATFSKPVDQDTVTFDTFSLTEAGAPVPGTVMVAVNRRSATFIPEADLRYDTEYTVSLTEDLRDAAGNPITAFVSTFTTAQPDVTSPQVTAVTPTDGDVDVAVASAVTVEFSEPVAAATVTPETFLVSAAEPVAGTVTVAADGLSATFEPVADLAHGTAYAVAVTAGITDGAGNPLVPFGSSFTTADPTPNPAVPALVSYRVDDGPSHDGTGNDSRGNNDGFAQCGETIELYVTVGNDGDLTLGGVTGTLIESDPYVSLLYNSSSSYPNLAPGQSAENPRDWDLRIADDVPGGHVFEFTVRYTADGAGPWDVAVAVPIDCGGEGPDPGPEPRPGLPVFASLLIDDGPSHDGTGNDSKGNNDATAQAGETIELYVTVRNDGDLTLAGLTGTLIESDPYVRLLYNTSSTYPDLAPGRSAANPLDWDLRISPDVPAGHVFEFTVRYTADGGGSWDVPVSIPIGGASAPTEPGPPVLVSYRVDDGPAHDGTGNDSKGNNDGIAQCGETIEIYVRVRNDGTATLRDGSGLLLETDPFVDVLYNTTSTYPDLTPGLSAENPRDWDLRISPDIPDHHEFTFTIRYTARDGSWDVPVAIPIHCPK